MSEIIRIADEGVLFGSSISVTVIERGPSFRGITLIFRPTTSFSAKEESLKSARATLALAPYNDGKMKNRTYWERVVEFLKKK